MEYWAATYHATGEGGVCHWSYLYAGRGIFACVLKVDGDDEKASLGYYCMRRLQEWARTGKRLRAEALEKELLQLEQELMDWQASVLRRREVSTSVGLTYLAGCICLDNQCLTFRRGQGAVFVVNRSLGRTGVSRLFTDASSQLWSASDGEKNKRGWCGEIQLGEIEPLVGLLLLGEVPGLTVEKNKWSPGLLPDTIENPEQLEKRLEEMGKYGLEIDGEQRMVPGELLYVLCRDPLSED